MDKFNSIFELLAAFNAAFIISQDFTTSLNTRINGVLDNSSNLLSQIEGILTESQKQITSKLSGAAPNQKEYLSGLAKENNQLNQEFEALKESVENKISNSGISNTFNYYCLFALIYSGLVLLLSGLEIDLTSGSGETFFIFNVVSLIVIASLVKRQGEFRLKTFFSTGYLAFLTSFPLAFIMCIPYHLIRKDGAICPFSFFEINLFFAFIIPSCHFIIYFIKSMINRKRLFPEINESVKDIRVKCERSAQKIADTIVALDAVQPKNKQ